MRNAAAERLKTGANKRLRMNCIPSAHVPIHDAPNRPGVSPFKPIQMNKPTVRKRLFVDGILKWNGQRFEGDDSGVGASLLGGWASGSDNVWIVGEGGTLLHQSGGGWQQVDTQTSRTLSAVTGTADGVFAVGGSGSVLRWDGSSLTTESTTCATALLGIGQVGADLLSVGEGYCMTRRSGGVWTAVPSMSVPPTDKSGYFSVVGSYQGSSYVSGRPGTLYKLDGTSWSQLELTTMGVARSLLVLPTGDVWIGGSDLYRANGSLPVRLNARPQETLYALSGATADAMWATGFSGTVLRRNGTTWEPVRSDATSPLYGVYSPSADVAFVIGFDSSESTLSRCSSKACSIIEKASNLEYTSIHGIDADNYWVVGKSGVLKMWSAKSAALVDETGSLPKGASLNHVHAVAGAGGARPSVIAVGEQGLVMRRTAMGWLPDSSAPTGKQNLLAVWASADSDVFVGGSNGLIAHFDGSAWAVIPTSVTDTISGIAGTSASDVWAVTVQGSVLRYDGQQFKTVSRDELPSLQAISAVDGQVYIAGALGTILHKS